VTIISKGHLVDLPAEYHSLPASKSTAKLALRDVEKQHIEQVLKKTKWRVDGKEGAAKLLGLPTSTLPYRINKLGICKPV
jgi:transcriptional regulator with GAF, ATPase, and Fis domain|tara:strand:+ start:262 stop:501 length:240 start_codon:yes stop_codon:yes gene_type:complete